MDQIGAFGSLRQFYATADNRCPLCREELRDIQGFRGRRDLSVDYCSFCGWWRADFSLLKNFQSKNFAVGGSTYTFSCVSNLLQLDLQHAHSLPIQALRDELVRRWEARFDVNPIVMEEIVGSIYRDFGGEVMVTSKSGDRGIDVLVHMKGSYFGVQVKRYKNSIKVGQIRELVGSLYLAGLEKGVFVTTSSFQRGVRDVAAEAFKQGIAVELIDANRLLAELKNAQLIVPRTLDDVPYPEGGKYVLYDMDNGSCGNSDTRFVWNVAPEDYHEVAAGKKLAPRVVCRAEQRATDSDVGVFSSFWPDESWFASGFEPAD